MSDGIKKVSENIIRHGRALTLVGREINDYDGIPVGTLRAIKEEQGLEYKFADNSWSKFSATGLLIPGTITTELLANKCVTNPKLADNAVDKRVIKDSEVITSKINDSAVTEIKINNNAVTTNKIKDLNVIESKLGNNSVTTIKIKNLNVTTEKLANSSVHTDKLANASVTNIKIANNSIDNIKLMDNTIEYSKYKNQSIYGDKIKQYGIESIHIKNAAISTSKLASGSVVTNTIANKTVTGDKLADNSIGNIHLINNSISTSKLVDLNVTTEKIANNSITMEKLHSSIGAKLNDAVIHDVNGHAQVKQAMTIGSGSHTATNGQYKLAVNGDMIANRVYNAVYQDIAESYTPGECLEVGDIVTLEEDGKVYKADVFSNCIVGVISDQYALCLGSTPEELRNKIKVPVGLIGKVPVKISGPVRMGDKIKAYDRGIGISTLNTHDIIGKALETNLTDDVKEVLCLIYPN